MRRRAQDRRRFERVRPLAAVVLVLLGVNPAQAQRRRFESLPSRDRRAIDAVREGALRRLRSAECQILEDFRGPSGRTLIESLEASDRTPDLYLARMHFLDGRNKALCASGRSQLLSTRGDAIVYVCKPFLETVWRQRVQAEAYVIHEMLHTLGLGENPPTSRKITQQVIRRCAP